MNWKKRLYWFLEFLVTTYCGDLLLDWFGAASMLSNSLPFIAQFIPHIAIAGIATIVATNIAIGLPFLLSLRPSEKFRQEYHRLRGLRESLPTDKSATFGEVDMRADESMRYIRDICLKYRIPCLEIIPLGSPRSKLLEWRYFANDLVRCSLNKNLKEARSLVNPQSQDK